MISRYRLVCFEVSLHSMSDSIQMFRKHQDPFQTSNAYIINGAIVRVSASQLQLKMLHQKIVALQILKAIKINCFYIWDFKPRQD